MGEAEITVFGMSLHDYLVMILVLAPIFGVIWAALITWSESNWKDMTEELDRLAGPVDDDVVGGLWGIFKRSFNNAWRRDLWVPLAVFRALLRRRKD